MAKKSDEVQQSIQELTADLQRVQADFVNYRRRVEDERLQLIDSTKAATVVKVLPLIDDIERALQHMPAELADNPWAQGIQGLIKNLEKALKDLGLERIEAEGKLFDPERHEAISMDEGEGKHEVVSEVLRQGYQFNGAIVRPSLVKVSRQDEAPSAPETIIGEELKETDHLIDDKGND